MANGDLAILTISGLGVAATMVLTILGFKIVSQFGTNERRITELEGSLNRDRENLYGSNMLTSITFAALSTLGALVDIHRRAIEDLQLELSVANSKLMSANFRKSIDPALAELIRISLCFKVMEAGDASEEAIETLVTHYPTFATADFLIALSKTRTGPLGERLATEAGRLEKYLRTLVHAPSA